MNGLFQSIFLRDATVRLVPSSYCPCCRLDTIEHMIAEFPAYEDFDCKLVYRFSTRWPIKSLLQMVRDASYRF